MSKIHFLPVNYGDSFVIECDKGEDHGVILVDGGPDGGGTLLMEKLKEVGTPDLMVLTHYDDDHINGLHQYMNICYGGKVEIEPAKEVWANCVSNIKKKEEEEAAAEAAAAARLGIDLPSLPNTKSLKQGVKLSRLLERLEASDKVVWHGRILEGYHGEFPFADIEVVSPTQEAYDTALGALLEESKNVKWQPAAKAGLEPSKRLKDLSHTFEELAKDEPKPPKLTDSSDLANANSIGFILQCDGLRVMMLGDCFPHNVVDYLRSQGYSEDNPLELDYLKVAHHGSEHNTNNELLDIIKCNHYIISTNGYKYQHPHRHSLAHILCHPKRDPEETVHFYFNCDVATMKANGSCFILPGEEEAYNFVIHENVRELLPLAEMAAAEAAAEDPVPAEEPEVDEAVDETAEKVEEAAEEVEEKKED